jgi:ABC-type transport system involved in cytochrome c biogenesis permease subunit
VTPLPANTAEGLLWGGVGCYAFAAALALRPWRSGRRPGGALLGPLACGALLLGLAVAERWMRLGYGPFLTLFEVLLSNLFTLGVVLTLILWRHQPARASAPVALGVLTLLGVWALAAPRDGSHLPATYDNPWLWVHVGSGKLFLAACLVTAGIAGRLLFNPAAQGESRRARVEVPAPLDAVAWRFLALAFVFHSLMLIAGAFWAQDAWGRYWAWDPLETWAFATWISMAFTLHARVTFHMPQRLGWSMMIGVFVLAFLTFFGVPFVSVAPHKGAV